MGGLFLPEGDEAVYFSRFDTDELLGSHVSLSFLLEETVWPSVEHYLQGMRYEQLDEQERVRQLETSAEAHRETRFDNFFGRWRKKQKADWSKLRSVYLTRAIYTQCLSHESVAARLLETEDLQLIENDQYDYYWGCGRDRRGTNMYGQVLMSVRSKLRQQDA